VRFQEQFFLGSDLGEIFILKENQMRWNSCQIFPDFQTIFKLSGARIDERKNRAHSVAQYQRIHCICTQKIQQDETELTPSLFLYSFFAGTGTIESL